MDQELTAAKNLFPARSRAIDELAFRDSNFRELCIDFADAHEAAQKWKNSNLENRDQFHAEYVELTDELALEIAAALNAAAVIPITAGRHKAQK